MSHYADMPQWAQDVIAQDNHSGQYTFSEGILYKSVTMSEHQQIAADNVGQNSSSNLTETYRWDNGILGLGIGWKKT